MADRRSTYVYNQIAGNRRNTSPTIRSNTQPQQQKNDDNFFAKKGRSIENALGTTGSALYETGGNLLGAAFAGLTGTGYTSRRSKEQNDKTDKLLKDNKQSMEDIYKKHGYNSADDFYNASNKAEKDIFSKYGFDSDSYWDKHAKMWSPAKANDKDVLDLEATRQNVINRMSKEDADTIRKFDSIQNELKGQASKNAEAVDKNAKEYKDYVQNNYASKKINQDRGKFAGSAINTLSTATDVLGLTNGPVGNAIQGGIEGIADELEQNGLENFDWERAKQNAITGAASGAATGLVNGKIDSALAKNGGKLFAGSNALTRGLNKIADIPGPQRLLGKYGGNAGQIAENAIDTIGSGAIRGAVSGAVGGATGAGVNAALNNQDILSNALQGATQGAQQGLTTGGIMAGANMAINNTPGVGKFLQDVNQAQRNWRDSGDNFMDRLTNTVNSGDSAVGNFINDPRQSLQNLAEKLPFPGAGVDDTMQTAGIQTAPEMRNPSLTGMGENTQDPSTEVYRRFANQGNTNNNAEWDNLAREYGFSNYEDATNRFAQQNPGRQATANDVLDWMDSQSSPTNMSTSKQRLRDIKAEAKETQAAKDLLAQVGTATAPAAKADNMVENVKKFMAEGLTKPEEWQLASDAITGANGVMSKMYRNLIAQAGDVDTFGGLGGRYGNSLEDTIDYYIRNEGLTDSEAKGVRNEIMGIIESLPSRNEGSLSMTDTAEDVMTAIRKLEARKRNYMGQDSRNHQNADPRKDAKASAINKVASMLEDKIYEKVPDARTVVTQDAIQELKNYFPGNEKWARSIDERFANIRTGKDLRAAQKRYVQTSDYLANVRNNYGTYGQRVGDAYGNALSQAVKKVPVVGGLLAQAANTPFMNRRYADLNMAQAQRLRGDSLDLPSFKSVRGGDSGNGGTPTIETAPTPSNINATNPSTQLFNAIGRNEGLNQAEQARTAEYLIDSAQEAEIVPNGTETAQELQATSGTTIPGATSVYNAMTSGQPQSRTSTNATMATSRGGFFPETGDYWTDMISGALDRAADANDVTAFAALYGMYQNALSNAQAQQEKAAQAEEDSTVKLNATQQAQLAKLNSANSAIDELEGLFESAGGGKGPILGNLQSIAGDWGWDSNAKTYNDLAEGLVNKISAAIGKTDSLNTEGEVQRALKLIPQLTDDAQTAKNKLEELRRMLADTTDSYNIAYGLAE